MIEELDILTLDVDLPAHGLKRGDLGAAVFVHPDGSCEAEFVSPSGQTLALITLNPHQFIAGSHAVIGSAGRAEKRFRTT